MRTTHLAALAFCSALLVSCAQESPPPAEPEGGEAPVVQEEAPTPVAGGSELERTAKLYATIICMLSDPDFWEGFWSYDDSEGGWTVSNTEEQEQDEAAIYTRYGFIGEEDATAAVERHIHKDA